MKSGLENRNNRLRRRPRIRARVRVSMKSGRKTGTIRLYKLSQRIVSNVSMKSGLEDRNNDPGTPGRGDRGREVSMKSGLEDRNNQAPL